MTAASVTAQHKKTNHYTLKIIRDKNSFVKSIIKKPGHAMLDIKKAIPGIITDLRYAGTSNFIHQQIYPSVTTTYLREKAAVALQAVQKELALKNLGLKIFDAYRPYSATRRIWELVKDERYAASPAKGSNHNRGVAVDLTIISIKTNEELDMGTGFDNFSDTAHHNFRDLPGAVLQNRKLLRDIMEKNGFKAMETEWWHYALPDAADFELLDLGFDQLKKLQR